MLYPRSVPFRIAQQLETIRNNVNDGTDARLIPQVSYLGVDTLMTRCPPLVKDMYYNEVDLTLPYTEAAVAYKRKTYRGSVHNMV